MQKAKRLLAGALASLLALGALPGAALAAEPVQTNVLTDYNTAFEGADDSGNLYWWNDANWSPENIARVAYGDSAKPSPDSGDYYLSVTADSSGVGTAQVAAADIAKLLPAGAEGAFSFYAKAEGDTEDGAISLNITSASADWSSSQGAAITWDSHPALTADWQLYTGTFAMPVRSGHDQVQIQLVGSSGLSFDVDTLQMEVTSLPKKEIEKDIPDLKDTVASASGLGEDAHIGVCVNNNQVTNETLMELVEKHFNAITFENELKPDALFGYQNDSSAALEFQELTWTRANGDTVTGSYPTLNFSLAIKMLDVIKAYNDSHPEDAIQIRGHVLTWHSQTPEWFFHEDWDASKPYVSAEEMDIRQEWFIKTVLETLTGPDSAYKDLFYGWDVVNEAVSDTTGTYRTEEESSSWWAVYQSEDFIINAFRYANYYAPETIELYYNDYNECVGNKVDGIAALLKAVKAHESDEILPTRIDGMGMQSHHNMSGPTVNQIQTAAETYGEIVGKVQLTELDLKASDTYDGTDATRSDEYTKQAYRYKEIYETMKAIDAMDAIDCNGITIWGIYDGASWLQSSSNVGGAADGTSPQCPLLFDDDYQAKPAFWAFVDPDKLEPYINNVVAMQAVDGEDPYAMSKTYDIPGIDASFQIIWDANSLKVKVTVQDATAEDEDGVDLYLDRTGGTDAPEKCSVARSAAKAVDGGYVAEFAVDAALTVGSSFAFDVVVRNGGESFAYNDLKMGQDTSSKYFAVAMAKPCMSISSGTVQVDGETDDAWANVPAIPLTIQTGTPAASASAKLLWDADNLYLLMTVTDPALDKSSSQVHEQDSAEVFLDENNGKTDGYEEDDKQFRINFDNEQSFNGTKCTAENVTSATKKTADGYVVEAAFKWTDITPAVGTEIGLELQINDGADGARIGTVSWFDESGQGWSSPAVFGTAVLADAAAQGSANALDAYTDVPADSPYTTALSYAVENSLMSGTSATTLEPDTSMTRAMMATMLWNLDGKKTGGESTFSDVAEGSWYADAIAWAADNALLTAAETGKFAPNETVTREQAVLALCRYAVVQGMDVTAAADLSAYTDADDVSTDALTAVRWAVSAGILSGDGTELNPHGTLTRAEAAALFMAFAEKAVQ